MRKPKGTTPGRLAKIVSGRNILAGKHSMRHILWGIVPGSGTSFRSREEVTVFLVGKPCLYQYSKTIPVGTVGMVLEGKRTRAKRGAIPYFIVLIEHSIYKIDATCVQFINENNISNC
jgi:hypothetical protein